MSAISAELHAQYQQAARRRHRLLWCLSGDHVWTESQALTLLSTLALKPLWVSDRPIEAPDAIDQNTARRWLGRECDALVYDAHSGFDPNILALLAGTVRAGGLLLLLLPAVDNLSTHDDPVNRRCTVWGRTVTRSRYLERIALRLPQWAQSSWAQGNAPLSAPLAAEAPATSYIDEQKAAVTQIVELCCAAPRALALIAGNRGRGKSAALGHLAASLAARGMHRIILTAPRKAAVGEVIAHATERWPACAPSIESCLRFVAPDALVLHPEPTDMVLVDEMGGLHLGLIKRILASYPRLVMAGTVHGYEGAGRGFHTRLRKHLADQHPYVQQFTLENPARWASDDPLESSIDRLLMLDAEAPPATGPITRICQLDRDALASDEALLRSVYGLLVDAHYRTRPLDLRQILDGPNIRLFAAFSNHALVAVATIATEGPMQDAQLNADIHAGRRRPQGHLLPQLLMQRLGIETAAGMLYWRVVRIAVVPQAQGRGHGSALLKAIEGEARTAGADLLGSIFAANAAVLQFWHRADLLPVFLGQNLEATSGAYAVTLIKALSPHATPVLAAARESWETNRSSNLIDSHPAMDPATRALLLAR